MARPKQQIKAKEPITIRFKELKDGSKSIYLDCYKDGKRSYRFLKLYIVPERSKLDRENNKNALLVAETIKSKLMIELAQGEAGIKKDAKQEKVLLADFAEAFAQEKASMASNGRTGYALIIRTLIKHFAAYRGEKTLLTDIDKEYCEGFAEYLKTTKTIVANIEEWENVKDATKEKTLSPTTQSNYFKFLNILLNRAVREGKIEANPIALMNKESKPKRNEAEREYLEIEELRQLIATDCSRGDVKCAFLFSCFTGLRYSDVKELAWSDLIVSNGQLYISKVQHKTKHKVRVAVSEDAAKWMPEQGDAKPDDKVFSTLPVLDFCNKLITRWCDAAGISKHISYHCSRHTCATLQLTLGTDLYTVSKMLGHTEVKTTQVYAKIVDSKLKEAADRTKGLF